MKQKSIFFERNKQKVVRPMASSNRIRCYPSAPQDIEYLPRYF